MITRRTLTTTLGAALLVCADSDGAFASQTFTRITKAGIVRIGFDNEAPWSFAQANGSLTGVSYDFAKLIFSGLGVHHVDGVLVTDFGSLIPGLKAKRFDVIVAGLYIRPARCKQVAFSEPTTALGDAVVVKAGNPRHITSYQSVINDPSIRLAGVVGAATAKNALAAGVPEKQLTMYPTFNSAVSAVLAGRADGALETAITAAQTIRAMHNPRLALAEPFKQPIINGKQRINYTAFAVRPSDKALLKAIDSQLSHIIGSHQYFQILDRYDISHDVLPKGVTTAALCRE